MRPARKRRLRIAAGVLCATLPWPASAKDIHGGRDARRPASTSGSQGPDAPAAPDSARALAQARNLQARFERRRFRELPRARGGSRRCQVVIGRLCVWHGDEPDPLPEEPAATARARTQLLADLAAIHARIPGDRWIFGQRVRYLLEAGRQAEAARLTRACGLADAWRCDAYLGLVLHEAGDVQGAEAVFRAALGDMPAETAAAWTDPAPLLDADLRGWLEAQPDSAVAAAHLWALADPLLLARGNDRWAGHMSRHAYAMSAERSFSPYQMRWGGDLARVVVRYGWPVAWAQTWPSGGEATGSVVGYDAPGVRRSVPPRAVLEPGLDSAVPWTVPPRSAGGRSMYVSPRVDSVGALAGQIGRFWRRDGVLVAAAATAPGAASAPAEGGRGFVGDGVGVGGGESRRDGSSRVSRPASAPPASALAGLFVVRNGETVLESWTAARPGRAVRLWGLAPPKGVAVASLETWVPAERAAHRLRAGLALPQLMPGTLAVSDLLLLEPGAAPENARQAFLAMRTRAAGEDFGALDVAFEVYGLGDRSDAVSLAAWVEGREGALARLARRLGLRGARRIASVRWTEHVPPGDDHLFRTLRIQLPRLAPGAYRLNVEAAVPGGLPARARSVRAFEILRPGRSPASSPPRPPVVHPPSAVHPPPSTP